MVSNPSHDAQLEIHSLVGKLQLYKMSNIYDILLEIHSLVGKLQQRDVKDFIKVVHSTNYLGRKSRTFLLISPHYPLKPLIN